MVEGIGVILRRMSMILVFCLLFEHLQSQGQVEEQTQYGKLISLKL